MSLGFFRVVAPTGALVVQKDVDSPTAPLNLWPASSVLKQVGNSTRQWDLRTMRCRAYVSHQASLGITILTMGSNPIVYAAFDDIVSNFAETIATNFKQHVVAQPEDQLKSPVGRLFEATGQLTELDVAWRTEVHPEDVDGRPDLGITVGGLLTVLVELKRPGTGARPETFTRHNRDQWEKFKVLPNLIYTDGSEWSLYRSGELAQRVRIAADVSLGGGKALDRDEFGKLHQLIRDSLYWKPIVPGTADGLARFLAPLARFLRDDVREALARGAEPIKMLASEWRTLLFPEGDDAQFADAYAQTVTYALLLARFEGADSLSPLSAVQELQRQHALLAEALQLLEAPSVRSELQMPIELLERAIQSVDSTKLHKLGDPWLYFYEQFLGVYDPKLRNDRGVYFTPVEVVQAQVALAGELLRTRFKKPLAFADDNVVVLDPAVGTGTYPLAVLDHAAEAVNQRLGPGAVPGKLSGLVERMYAFELLVGPYSVAHLRLSQRLREAGVARKAARVYLTDTLESPNHPPEFTSSLLQAQLTEERVRAIEVKKAMRVFVCLGNPPYDREERDPNDNDGGQRKGGWVRFGDPEQEGIVSALPILEDFLAPVREAGQGVHLKNLYNDYVYFWRWALWKVLDSTEDVGIVTFITASSYLRGPGFAGMRRKMREVFDELWIIDLEGDSLGARKTENVFAIRTPVAIAVGVREGPPLPGVPARIWKTRLTGTEQTKLKRLHELTSFDTLEWEECTTDWDSPFYSQASGSYSEWPQITDVFPWQHSGSQFKRTWPIGETKDVIIERWAKLASTPSSQRSAVFKETRDRSIVGRYPNLFDPDTQDAPISAANTESATPSIQPYAFRSFDLQWAIADSRIGDFLRPELWRSYGPRQVYITSLLTSTLGFGPAVVATAAVPDLHHFNGRGAKDVIPLWRDAAATSPNITRGLSETISKSLSYQPSSEEIFAYAYGILTQPAYVEEFWDELEMPPPRLPITKEADLFQRVADHGARLLYLHTYGERFKWHGEDGSVPLGFARCTKAVSLENYPEGYSYDPLKGVLQVGVGEFAPVSPAVWEYSVSGLQIVKSWLDRRKMERSGRKSSPLDETRPQRWVFTEELLQLLWVLEATIALQPEGEALLTEVCSSTLFLKDELPTPTTEERQPPSTKVSKRRQHRLVAEAEE